MSSTVQSSELTSRNVEIAGCIDGIKSETSPSTVADLTEQVNALLFSAIDEIPHLAGGVEVEFDLDALRGSKVQDWIDALTQGRPLVERGDQGDSIKQSTLSREQLLAAQAGKVVVPLPFRFETSAIHGSRDRSAMSSSNKTLAVDASREESPALNLSVTGERGLLGLELHDVPLSAVRSLSFLPVADTDFTPTLGFRSQLGTVLFSPADPVRYYLQYRRFGRIDASQMTGWREDSREAGGRFFVYNGLALDTPLHRMTYDLERQVLFVADSSFSEALVRQVAGIATEYCVAIDVVAGVMQDNPGISQDELRATLDTLKKPKFAVETISEPEVILRKVWEVEKDSKDFEY